MNRCDIAKAPTTMNCMPEKAFFWCLWVGIIKRGKIGRVSVLSISGEAASTP